MQRLRAGARTQPRRVERARTRRPDAPPLALIIVDVLRAAIGGEENSSDVVGAAMSNVAALARMFGAAVLLVHHAARADAGRARGSSAFDAAQDFIGAVEKDGDTIKLTVTKNKNGPGGQTFSWELRDGVLRPTAAPGSASAAPTAEVLARLAGRVIREIAAPGQAVTRKQLADAMKDAVPGLLGESVNRSTAGRAREPRVGERDLMKS